MTRYSKIACTILFAVVTSTTITIAPWMHTIPATATQALQIAQNSDSAVIETLFSIS